MSVKETTRTGNDHFVDTEPFNPAGAGTLTPEQERYFQASQWQIMWWKFRRHRLAVWSAVILFLFYLCVPFAEIIAPYAPNERSNDHLYAPPQSIHLFHDGAFVGPFVYGMKADIDLETVRWVYTEDRNDVQPLRFFCSGSDYEFWGLVEGSFHLVCPAEGGSFYPLGTDRLGRDVLSG